MKISRAGQKRAAAWPTAAPTSGDQCCGAVGHSSHVVSVMLKRLCPHPLLLAAAGSHRDQLKMEYCPLGCAHHETVFLIRYSNGLHISICDEVVLHKCPGSRVPELHLPSRIHTYDSAIRQEGHTPDDTLSLRHIHILPIHEHLMNSAP